MSDKAVDIDITLPRSAFDVQVKTRIHGQGITAIFGPSGAGKSSLLRAVAGFETPESGQIKIGGRVVFDSIAKINVPPHQRRIGYLFQDARLFSHLDVRGNLDFATKRAPAPGSMDVDDVITAFSLDDLLDKDVTTLSGGEGRRVALARTLLSRPDILLLDEPLVALDSARKSELLRLIRELAGKHSLPIIYVSHDSHEIGTLADNIICLEKGKIRREGEALAVLPYLQNPDEVYGGVTSWFDAQLIETDNARFAAIWSLSERHQLVLPLRATAKIGDISRLCINANDVSLALKPPRNISIQNKLDARIVSLTPQENRVLVKLHLPDVDRILPHLYAFITPRALAELKLDEGQVVSALVKSVSVSR